MDAKKKVKLIQTYLESMFTHTPLNPHTVEKVTLADLRPRGISQEMVAEALKTGEAKHEKRDRATISNWERGIGVDRIRPSEIVKLAILFKRDIVEIHAAIANTRTLTEEDTEDIPDKNAPPPEVVQR